LLAIGFLVPSIPKIMGRRFTNITIDNPVGALFEALYQTSIWWHAIGWAQVLAAVLLLSPWATLGACLYLAIITNIFLITISLDFHGTPYITGLMLLGTIGLLAWDAHKFLPLLHPQRYGFQAPAALGKAYNGE
jgi:hypothetical protein